jgi:hypothetical protein
VYISITIEAEFGIGSSEETKVETASETSGLGGSREVKAIAHYFLRNISAI